MLKTGGMRPSSRLRNLGPFIDDAGLIRVSGRLHRSTLSEEAKHPLILDPKDRLISMIIDKTHKENGHVGAQHTLHRLRQEYWILHGLAAVKKRITACVYCQKVRKPMMMQQMAALPPQRLTPDMPPFTFTGLDFFGPINTKLARKEFKRYGCIFTCLCSRAVHLEMAYDLSTDSFLSCFSRFTARRGQPKEVMSDNGTNFVGGEKILRDELRKIDQKRVNSTLTQRGITWKFIAARSPHWRGVWERLVQSTKKGFISPPQRSNSYR